jgi:pimeloyl-ACP methyl ester carboxylesterase
MLDRAAEVHGISFFGEAVVKYGDVPAGVRFGRGFADTSLGLLHYRQLGDEGPPLVLLHNTWMSSKVYLGVMPKLAEHFRVYALDTLGCGDSDPVPPDRVLMIPDYAKVMLEALDSLGFDKPNIVGHHTGSIILAEAAIQAPEKFRKIMLSGLPFWRNPQTRLNLVETEFFANWEPKADGSHLIPLWQQHSDIRRTDPDTAAIRFIDYMKPGPRTSMALRALLQWPSREKLPQITVPTLITCAEGDPFGKNIEHVKELIPNSQLKLLPGGDEHPLYHPFAFADAIIEYYGQGR